GHLVARQLSAFTRLRALRHLDLYLFRARKICRSHTKAARCNLLDRAVWPIPIFATMETLRIFAPFPGIRFSTNLVHRNREALMGFRTECAKRHPGGRKPAPDLFNRLNLFERDSLFSCRDPLEQVPERIRANRADRFDVRFVILRLVRLYERMEALDYRRRDRVHLALSPKPVVSRVTQLGHLVFFRHPFRECLLMPRDGLRRDLSQTDPFNFRRGSAEAFVRKFRTDPYRFEYLGASIAVDH